MRTINPLGCVNTPSPVTHYCPQDFSVAYTTNSGIAITGASFLVDNSECRVVYLKYRPSGTQEWTNTLVNGVDGISMNAESDVINVGGLEQNFSSGDEFEVGLQYQEKGYSSAVDGKKVIVLNPQSDAYAGEVLADVTNGADDTYYYYLDMSGYRRGGFQFVLDGGSGSVTVTVEGTLQDDGTAASSCTYADITSATFGVASTTSSTIWIDDTGKLGLYKYIRVKVVASTSAADDADWSIYSKRLY